MMVQGVAVSANVTIRMVKGTNKCTATSESELQQQPYFVYRLSVSVGSVQRV
mgnify:CR=1 FL=1